MQTEQSLLARITRTTLGSHAQATGVALGIGDDAALWKPRRGRETILTCDWFLEGTHFLRGKHPADSVGWKCLARAVSDIAAMGGEPRCFLLSLALPESRAGWWLDEFLQGLKHAAQTFRCALAGGDTTRRGEILINVTVVGEIESRLAVTRSGAREGDLIFVTGRLGEAEFGLELLRQSKRRIDSKDALLKKHLYPEPRLAGGRFLARKHIASAMMDISDGLSTDLGRLCAASKVGAVIEAASIPAVPIPKGKSFARFDPLKLALDGGDDYELLFTVPRNKVRHVPSVIEGVPMTRIGTITRDRRMQFIDQQRRVHALRPGGWDPFRK